jgi:hypothetical protein
MAEDGARLWLRNAPLPPSLSIQVADASRWRTQILEYFAQFSGPAVEG